MSPPSHDDLRQAVIWAAGSGGREEHKLLRWIEEKESEPGDTLDFVRHARADIHQRLKEDRELLAVVRDHRRAPDQALYAIGEIGRHASTSRGPRRAPRELLPEPDPIPALYDALTTSDDATLRGEAAWALGQVANVQAARCLLMHLFQTWGDPLLPAQVQAALIGGLGRALDPYVLYQMRPRPAVLRRLYGLLLHAAQHLDALDEGLRMDLIGTLVAVELRSELVGVDLRAGSALELFVGMRAMPYARTIAAVAALNELAAPAERRALWRWARGEGELPERLKPWPDRLAGAASRPFSAQELRGFLLAAGRFDAIRLDVEASYCALGRAPGEGARTAAPAA